MGESGASTLCLGASQLDRSMDKLRPIVADGIATVPIATDRIPARNGNAVLAPGDTRFFQFWFRDQGAASNHSDAAAQVIE